MIAVENYIDVGNVPIKFHLCLFTNGSNVMDVSEPHARWEKSQSYLSECHKVKLQGDNHTSHTTMILWHVGW